MARILIINREWKEVFDIPRWKSGRNFNKETFDAFCSKFKEMYVDSRGKLDKSSLDFERPSDPAIPPDYYILKLHVDICLMNMGAVREKFYKRFASFLLQFIDPQDKGLFLFHAKEDFAVRIPALHTENTWYEQFKGGTEPAYAGYGGILVDKNYHPESSQKDELTGRVSIEPGKVAGIWNYYFYRTRQKLLQMREYILRAQIPNISDEGKQLSKAIVCNLLENLNESVKSCTPVASVPYNLDFSNGRDLPELRKKVLTDPFIKELKKFVEEDKPASLQLNRFLNTMLLALT